MKFRIIAVLAGLAIIGFLGYKLYPVFSSHQDQPVPYEPQPSAETNSSLFAVVVENLPEARPQSGLSLADFVIETLSESGITRFLVFYRNQAIDKLGPVRSARPYFVDWAAGWDAIFVHSGGSKEGLAKIEELGPGFRDLNEFYNEKTFWRESTRPAPHNLYTSQTLLADVAIKKNWLTSKELGWSTKSDESNATSTVSEIDIDFSSPSYFVTYKYSRAENSYNRFIANKPDIDSLNRKQISPKNVVVLYTSSTVIDPELLTISLQTLGSGRALIFRDGQVLQARWKKDGVDAPLKLLEADNSLIELNEGQTWFAVVDQNGVVTWK